MSVFTADGELLVPTAHAGGPWDPGSMHGGAPSGLIARAVERLAPEMRLGRLTVELLGPVPLEPVQVEAAITKPGRSFQIADATLSAGGRERCRARAMLVRRGSVEGVPAGAEDQPPEPAPDALPRSRFLGLAHDGFHI